MNPLNPYVLLVGAIAIFGAITGAYFYGHSNGVDSERVVWQGKENKALIDVQTKLDNATAANTLAEQNYAKELQNVSTIYQKELIDVSSKKDAVIAALRTGAIRLRDPGTRYTLDPNPVSGTSSSASGCDGGSKGQLSDSTAEFLASEASRADAIVKQLAAAQAVILKDRELK